MSDKISGEIKYKWKQSFAFGDEEKEIIEIVQKEQRSSFNSALRHIVIEYGKKRTMGVH